MIRPFRNAGLLCAALVCLVLFGGLASSQAQVQVDIAMKRSLFIVYEPILVTVTITNLSGKELLLVDNPQHTWFGFQVETLDGRPLPPVGGTYLNEPIALGSGQKISRTVNLTPLFPIGEFGSYRIKANVFVAESNRYFSSPSLNIEITDGKVLWNKTVGVPEGEPGAGSTRTISLLAHRLPQSNYLYLRIEDKPNGVIYCTHQLGRFLSFGEPDILLDQANQIHILQNSAPKTFIYTKVGLNGKVLGQKTYNEFSTRPGLRRVVDGSVAIVGGQVYDPVAAEAERQKISSIGDRPVPLPGASPTPKEKRPDNLLSE